MTATATVSSQSYSVHVNVAEQKKKNKLKERSIFLSELFLNGRGRLLLSSVIRERVPELFGSSANLSLRFFHSFRICSVTKNLYSQTMRIELNQTAKTSGNWLLINTNNFGLHCFRYRSFLEKGFCTW